MPRSYGNYSTPRNYKNTDRNNSWSYDWGNNSRRNPENDSRRPHRDRSPLAEYSDRNRYYTRDYRSSSSEQDTEISFYVESKNEAPLEPTNVQITRPEQDAKTKVEIEELKSKVDALETSNKNLKEQMAFLSRDNLFLTKDNERLIEKLKEMKEELLKIQKDNLDELNQKHLEKESSFVHLKHCNANLYKQREDLSRSAEKLAPLEPTNVQLTSPDTKSKVEMEDVLLYRKRKRSLTMELFDLEKGSKSRSQTVASHHIPQIPTETTSVFPLPEVSQLQSFSSKTDDSISRGSNGWRRGRWPARRRGRRGRWRAPARAR